MPFSYRSDTGMTVLLQGIELNVLNVPLHEVLLKSNLITGPVVVGVRPSLPVRKVSLILGNDLAGGKVVVNPHVSSLPCGETKEKEVEEFPGLFSACAVTRARSRAAKCQVDTGIVAKGNETLEGIADTFLGDENKDCFSMASVPILEDPFS